MSDPFTVSGRYWHAVEDGRVQCDLCPRFCRLREGQRGMCFVRARQGDEIVLTTYGRSSGFCIDPIEKKPLNHFLPGTPILSFGTAGCNLACKFCQNWDMTKSRDLDRLQEQALPVDIARAAVRTPAQHLDHIHTLRERYGPKRHCYVRVRCLWGAPLESQGHPQASEELTECSHRMSTSTSTN